MEYTRGSLFFLGKVTALGVLCCFALFVCLTLLASFFLPHSYGIQSIHVRFGPSQLSCLGSSVVERSVECRVSWVRVPPEAAHFS